MSATQLTGVVRADDLIELTGTHPDFRAVAQAAGMRFTTIPLPADPEPQTADHPVDRLILSIRDWQKPKPLRFALLTQAAFEAHGLHSHVTFPRDPNLPDAAEAARAVGRVLKTLLLDRRDSLTLDRMAAEMTAKLDISASGEMLGAMLVGNALLSPGLLNAMLIALHAHKPLTPGSLTELRAHLADKPDPGLTGLLKFPQPEIARAYHKKQISVAEDGGVTLAGVRVTPDITIFFPEEAAPPPRRKWNNRSEGRDLRQVATPEKGRATVPH